MRGRKPKTVAQKKATGNPGKRRLTTIVGPPRQGDMLCPRAVEDNVRARAYWAMYLSNAAPGHLSPIDAPLLARLCIALALADEANELMMQHGGMLVKDQKTGNPVENPYLPLMNKQAELARKLASELALPPVQRNRLGPVAHVAVSPEAEAAGWAELEALEEDLT